MTKLSTLHRRLADLRRRRRAVRVSTGLTALANALLWTLLALFLADWLLRMTQAQRVVALAIALGALAWAFYRYALPWLSFRETELDVALLVERQHRIDSDLVAALQFERPEARRWGSVQLEEQVIDYSAQIGTRLDVSHDIPRKDLNRRAVMLATMAVVLGLIAWLFPEYVRVFLDRLLLGNRHYPTQTSIDAVAINGHPVDLAARRQQTVVCPYGQPVRFEVTCSGKLPEAGHAALRALSGGLQTSVPLEPTARPEGAYVGLLPRLVDSVNYQLYLGDAWTDPATLRVVPLPMIDVRMEVVPPPYARDGDWSVFRSDGDATTQRSQAENTDLSPSNPPKTLITGLRYVSVIEGSRVTVRITSDATLEEATFSVGEKAYQMTRDASRGSKSGEDYWVLQPGGTPLEAVVEPIRYTIQVTDTHKLKLERPIQGMIRIKPDLGPRIAGRLVTRHVLPTARPSVSYTASDDYGLTRLLIVPEVVHADGTTATRPEIVIYELEKGKSPRKEIDGRFRVDLAPLGAVKGDQVKLTLQAVDYRGQRPGKAAPGEPLVLEVTDEQGILAAMAETDRESARQLQGMIQRQIDVGEKP